MLSYCIKLAHELIGLTNEPIGLWDTYSTAYHWKSCSFPFTKTVLKEDVERRFFLYIYMTDGIRYTIKEYFDEAVFDMYVTGV